jgi:hypothetical protein
MRDGGSIRVHFIGFSGSELLLHVAIGCFAVVITILVMQTTTQSHVSVVSLKPIYLNINHLFPVIPLVCLIWLQFTRF